MVSGSLSMSTRRALLVVTVAALLCGASGLQAQAPAPAPEPAPAQEAAPAQAAAPAADSLKLSGDSALLIWTVKSAGAADFQSAWLDIKAGLMASEKPDMKALGESINIFKATNAGTPGGPVIFVFEVTPPSQTLSYDPVKILFTTPGGPWEAKRPDADAIWKKIEPAFEGVTALPLAKVGS